mmetsp:Transcript_9066/g.1330  ORF Transcript_9066/g.1330 Transcript_9066/m.1330 type:complete len:160 (-) Transcript_9066:2267-2746(-)
MQTEVNAHLAKKDVWSALGLINAQCASLGGLSIKVCACKVAQLAIRIITEHARKYHLRLSAVQAVQMKCCRTVYVIQFVILRIVMKITKYVLYKDYAMLESIMMDLHVKTVFGLAIPACLQLHVLLVVLSQRTETSYFYIINHALQVVKKELISLVLIV